MKIRFDADYIKRFNKISKALKCSKCRVSPYVKYDATEKSLTTYFINEDATILFEEEINCGFEVIENDEIIFNLDAELYEDHILLIETNPEKVTYQYGNGMTYSRRRAVFHYFTCEELKENKSNPPELLFNPKLINSACKVFTDRIHVEHNVTRLYMYTDTVNLKQRCVILGIRK